jgi:hypothetical protein
MICSRMHITFTFGLQTKETYRFHHSNKKIMVSSLNQDMDICMHYLRVFVVPSGTVNRLLFRDYHQIPSDSQFQKVILNCNTRENIILRLTMIYFTLRFRPI